MPRRSSHWARAAPPCIRPSRRACRRVFGSLIGTRTECIREREAHRRAPSKLCSQRPGFRKDPGLLLSAQHNRPAHRRRPAIDGSHFRRRRGNGGRSLTTCRKTTSVLADGLSCTFCGCSSAGRARPRHGRGHEFETRHPLHFGCVLSLRCRVTWCWRCGMCATLGQATCSETPHPTGCSRLGTAEVDLHRPRSSAGRAAAL